MPPCFSILSVLYTVTRLSFGSRSFAMRYSRSASRCSPDLSIRSSRICRWRVSLMPFCLSESRMPSAAMLVMFSLAGDDGDRRHDSRIRGRGISCQYGECGQRSEDSAGPAERAIHIPRLYHVYVMQRGRNQLRIGSRLPVRMLRIGFIFLLVSAAFAQRSGQSPATGANAKPGSVRGVVVGAADEPLR